jgi:aromatic-L-amino-acid decarboxylase
MTKWHHPNFYAYFPSEASLGSLLGEMLSTSLNTPTFAWHTSPTATELENIIADWIV